MRRADPAWRTRELRNAHSEGGLADENSRHLKPRLPDRGERISRWQFNAALPRPVADAVVTGGIATEVIPDVAKAFDDIDVLTELARYPGPVWLINGARDHFRRHERRFLEACVDGRLFVVPGAGHYLPLTHTAEFSRFVLDAAAVVERVDFGG